MKTLSYSSETNHIQDLMENTFIVTHAKLPVTLGHYHNIIYDTITTLSNLTCFKRRIPKLFVKLLPGAPPGTCLRNPAVMDAPQVVQKSSRQDSINDFFVLVADYECFQ